ncbi:hypothetical protein FH972_023888 [Carpinus fangiana]|uniref:Uncharacterized protein n=1 Tax=Carpinus fangiana TaxID=176857 RepID=A0A5N6KWG9_9ROSI|nr:hypothetical protein FH972_023888 [Carpinus fangiana]
MAPRAVKPMSTVSTRPHCISIAFSIFSRCSGAIMSTVDVPGAGWGWCASKKATMLSREHTAARMSGMKERARRRGAADRTTSMMRDIVEGVCGKQIVSKDEGGEGESQAAVHGSAWRGVWSRGRGNGARRPASADEGGRNLSETQGVERVTKGRWRKGKKGQWCEADDGGGGSRGRSS